MKSLNIDGEKALSSDHLLAQRKKLQEMTRAYRKSRILLTCVELGIFEVLAENGKASAQTIAEITQTNQRGIDLLLNAAVALGLLTKTDGYFVNNTLSEACLVSGSEGNLVRSLRLENAFFNRWGHLTEAVRSGKRPEENRRDEEPDDWVRQFIYALYNNAKPVAPVIAEAIVFPEDQAIKLIDVGGGHGAYSMALAKRYPLLSAVVFELPKVIPVANEIIENAGYADRVKMQEGDFQKEDLGSGYDAALVFGVLNGEPLEGRPALIKKVYDALNPGGRIILRDSVLDPDRAGPLDATMFALQMLLATESGGLDSRDDWNMWLGQAGFQDVQILTLPDPPGSSLTIATKP